MNKKRITAGLLAAVTLAVFTPTSAFADTTLFTAGTVQNPTVKVGLPSKVSTAINPTGGPVTGTANADPDGRGNAVGPIKTQIASPTYFIVNNTPSTVSVDVSVIPVIKSDVVLETNNTWTTTNWNTIDSAASGKKAGLFVQTLTGFTESATPTPATAPAAAPAATALTIPRSTTAADSAHFPNYDFFGDYSTAPSTDDAKGLNVLTSKTASVDLSAVLGTATAAGVASPTDGWTAFTVSGVVNSFVTWTAGDIAFAVNFDIKPLSEHAANGTTAINDGATDPVAHQFVTLPTPAVLANTEGTTIGLTLSNKRVNTFFLGGTAAAPVGSIALPGSGTITANYAFTGVYTTAAEAALATHAPGNTYNLSATYATNTLTIAATTPVTGQKVVPTDNKVTTVYVGIYNATTSKAAVVPLKIFFTK